MPNSDFSDSSATSQANPFEAPAAIEGEVEAILQEETKEVDPLSKLFWKWAFVCGVSATPSFIVAMSFEPDWPAKAGGMVTGILLFVLSYVYAERTKFIQDLLKNPLCVPRLGSVMAHEFSLPSCFRSAFLSTCSAACCPSACHRRSPEWYSDLTQATEARLRQVASVPSAGFPYDRHPGHGAQHRSVRLHAACLAHRVRNLFDSESPKTLNPNLSAQIQLRP